MKTVFNPEKILGLSNIQSRIILKNLFRWDFEAKHPTLNKQHPTPNAKLEVECWLLDVLLKSAQFNHVVRFQRHCHAIEQEFWVELCAFALARDDDLLRLVRIE